MKTILICLTLLCSVTLPAMKNGRDPGPGEGGQHLEGTTRAVVIGISDYQDEDIPDLKFADRDAKAFANWLHLPGGKNLDPDNIVLLLNNDATLGKVSAAVAWLIEESKPGDHSIIYFSGHGDMENQLFGMGHLLLWDSPAKAYLAGGLPVERLQAVVSVLSVKLENKVLLVTDACHSGKLAGNNIAGAQLTNANLSTQFSNEQKILSCQPDEYSIEGEQWGGGRGAFSWHLINGLCGLADENNDQNITLMEIEHYLQDRVPQEVEPLSQVPMAVGNKAEIVGKVDQEMLAMLEKGEDLPIQSFSRVEQRGVVEDVLANVDTSIVQLYNAFILALDEKRLLEPKDNCAETFYEQLIRIESIAPFHNFLRRNLAAVFQEDAQQAINAYLLADQEELNRLSRWDDKYRLYPLYLEKAAELLGPESHFYTSLVARQKYFEALYLRLFFDVVNQDPLFHAAVQKLNESLELEPNAPYVYQELGLLYDRRLKPDTAVSYFLQAIERSPAWLLPYMELQEIYRYNGWPADYYERFKNAFPILESKAGSRKYLVYAMASVNSWAHAYESPAAGSLNEDQRKVFEKEAEQLIMAAMKMEGAADWLWNYWIWKLDLMGRHAESLALRENAMARFPYHAVHYSADSKLAKGEIEKGLALKLKALLMSPYRTYDHIEFCQTLMGYGQTEKALEMLEWVFQLDPGYYSKLSHNSSMRTAAVMFDRLGRREIVQQFRDLEASIDPANFGAYQQIGWDYLIIGDYESARQYFEEAIRIDPGFPNTYYDLAWLYFSFGQKAASIRILDEAIQEKGVEDLVLYGHRAMFSAFFEPMEIAKAHFEAAVKFHPAMMKTWECLELMEGGQYERADTVYSNLIKESILWWETRFLRLAYVRMKIRQGEYKKAIDLIDECQLDHYTFNYNYINTDEDFASLWELPEWTALIKKYFPQKFSDKTAGAVTEDTSTFPYQANFNRLMGLYHRYHKQYDKSIQYFLKSLDTAPDNDVAKIYLADLYQKTGRNKEANAIAPKELESDGLEAHWVAGSVYYHLNQGEKAARHFKEFVRLANDNRFPNNRVGAFYRIHGDFALADTFLREDLRLHPDDKTFPRGDCRCEANLQQKDIRLHPTNLTSRLNLALVYFFSGQPDKCFELLHESIKKEPGQVSLQALLAFLHYFYDPESSATYFSKTNAIAPGFSQLWNDLELMRNDQYEQADRAWQDAQDRFTDWWMEIVKYQYLQMKIRQGKLDQAMTIFEEILEKGVFVNYQFFEKQKGWDRFRKLPGYGELMRRYFPEKY